MPDLLAGTRVLAEDFPPAVFGEEPTNIEDFNSTVYAAPSTPLAITFTAGTSGRVKIDMQVAVDADVAGGAGISGSIEVRETNSSGTVVFSPLDVMGIDRYWHAPQPSNEIEQAWVYLSGLTPGQAYWAQLQYKIDTGGGPIDFAHQALLATPLP